MADTPTRLAECLKALRRRRRIGQKDLASAAGVSRTLITNIERGIDLSTGRPPNPQPNTLRQLAVGLATDGDGVVDDDLAEQFYAGLMDAAGYLPAVERPWSMADALRGQIPQDTVDELVARWSPYSEQAQRAIVTEVIATAREIAREKSDEMLARQRPCNRPA